MIGDRHLRVAEKRLEAAYAEIIRTHDPDFDSILNDLKNVIIDLHRYNCIDGCMWINLNRVKED